MPENFIVTVTNVQGTFETDLQIPARLKISEFDDKLLEILKILDEREFRRWNRLQMSVNGRVLRGSVTFASAGVFDGSRIVVAEM
jgi:uncharacterized ubiquitin-like protein YukD